MTAPPPVDQLRDYLRELKPEKRALLVAEIERGRLRGAAFPGADLVLEELRPVLRTTCEQPLRVDSQTRLFFRPLDPFMVDGRFDFPVCGRVHRSALMAIWTWICRDLVPDAARSYSDRVAAAVLAQNYAHADELAGAFQDLVAGAMQDLLEARMGEREQRRLAGQIGIPRALEETRAVQHLLANREELAALAERLPPYIPDLGGQQLVALLRQLTEYAGNPALLVSALVLVRNRLRTFWHLARFAVASAESDVAARVEKSPLASAMTIVLADLRCMNEELRSAFQTGRLPAAVSLVRAIQDAVRALRVEVDFSADCALNRDLGRLRAEASDLLAAEIKNTPGLVRRLLRVGSGRGAASNGDLDALTVAEVESRIELLSACRASADDLALNQLAPRLHAELQNVLDNATERLLESFRKTAKADREAMQGQLGAALRFSATLFGPEHGAQLAKAAALAGYQGATPRR